jgi:hypothetical protein
MLDPLTPLPCPSPSPQKLTPEYAKAATALKQYDPTIVLAKVCTGATRRCPAREAVT